MNRGFVVLASMHLCFYACSTGGSDESMTAGTVGEAQGAAGKCVEKLKQIRTELATQTSNSAAAAKACDATISKTREQLTSARKQLQTAEAKLAIAAKTPAGVYSDLSEVLMNVKTVSDVESAMAAIESFNRRFPGTKEGTALKKQKKALAKKRGKFASAEADAKALAAIEKLRELMKDAKDGNEVDLVSVLKVGTYLKAQRLGYDAIKRLPRGSFDEAMKDPDRERGRRVAVRGTVIQISRDGDYFKGLICADRFCNKIYYFLTPGSTRGIVQRKRGSFAGVILHRMSYSNSGGGTTHSVVLVGYFKGQH